MEDNPLYEDSRLPVYEELQLGDKVEQCDVRVELTERSASNIPDNTNAAATSIKKETNLKAKCISLVIVLSLLAITMVAAIALSVYALVISNQGMDSVMLEFQELKMQLNKTKEEKTDGMNTVSIANLALLGNLLSSVNALNVTNSNFMAELNSLESSVSSLNRTNGAAVTQLNSLQSSVSSLNTTNQSTTTQLNSLQSSVSTLESVLNSLSPGQVVTTVNAISSLQSSVNSLTTRVNSPVNLYQNCTQETESCTSTQSGSAYRKFCTTPSLPVNKSGYYTLSMACKYDPSSGSLDTTGLHQSGSNVACLCVATADTAPTGAHVLTSFRTFTCTLVITRCPTSQNIV